MAGKIRRDNVRSRLLHRVVDVGINWVALVLAYEVKERLHLGVPTAPLTPEVILHTLAAIAFIWLATGSALAIYAYKRPLFPEIVRLIATLALTIAFFNTYVYFTRHFVYPRYGMILYAVIGSAMLVVSRSIKHAAQRAMHRHGYGVRRVLIVGTGRIAQRLAEAFRENHSLGYRFLGFVGQPDEDHSAPDVVGDLDELEAIINRMQAEELVVALPGHLHQQILNIAYRCQTSDIRLRVVPDLFEAVMIRATLSEIDDIPLIGLRDPVITGYQSIVKRLFDLAVATFCLVLAVPLFILVPIAILIESRGQGPVFFAQDRVGENGKRFRMYKFRSMIPGAEKLVDIERLPPTGPKSPDDPRVTRLGRLLRRMSLDELPQLINVLKGDMSMVGPRPEQVDVVKHYSLWHRKRLSIKPGLTGPMQVSGRGVLSLDERINLELMYISRYSLFEDLKYLLRTIPAVCRARGAY